MNNTVISPNGGIPPENTEPTHQVGLASTVPPKENVPDSLVELRKIGRLAPHVKGMPTMYDTLAISQFLTPKEVADLSMVNRNFQKNLQDVTARLRQCMEAGRTNTIGDSIERLNLIQTLYPAHQTASLCALILDMKELPQSDRPTMFGELLDATKSLGRRAQRDVQILLGEAIVTLPPGARPAATIRLFDALSLKDVPHKSPLWDALHAAIPGVAWGAEFDELYDASQRCDGNEQAAMLVWLGNLVEVLPNESKASAFYRVSDRVGFLDVEHQDALWGPLSRAAGQLQQGEQRNVAFDTLFSQAQGHDNRHSPVALGALIDLLPQLEGNDMVHAFQRLSISAQRLDKRSQGDLLVKLSDALSRLPETARLEEFNRLVDGAGLLGTHLNATLIRKLGAANRALPENERSVPYNRLLAIVSDLNDLELLMELGVD